MSDANQRLLREKHVLEMLPISRSTWWAGVKSGRFPKPLKLGPRITVWRLEDVRGLLENGLAGHGSKAD